MKSGLRIIQWLLLVLFIALSAKVKSETYEKPFSRTFIATTINDVANMIELHFIDKTIATSLSNKLRNKVQKGEFNDIESTQEFISQLNTYLIDHAENPYLKLLPVEKQSSLLSTNKNIARDITTRNTTTRDTIDFQVLEGNIGVISFQGDFSDINFQAQLNEILTQLKAANTLIIDLRDAHSTSFEFAHYFLSYFFDDSTQLSTLTYEQHREHQTIYSYENILLAKHFKNKPLYIVQSAFVEKEWEFFSYTLQQFNKAVVIGEESMGIATLTNSFQVNDTFSLSVPYAYTNHPISETNWEGQGVVPEYFAKSAKAKLLAIELASQK